MFPDLSIIYRREHFIYRFLEPWKWKLHGAPSETNYCIQTNLEPGIQSIHHLPYGTEHPTTNGIILPGKHSDRCFPGDNWPCPARNGQEESTGFFFICESNNKNSMIPKQFYICGVKFWCWVLQKQRSYDHTYSAIVGHYKLKKKKKRKLRERKEKEQQHQKEETWLWLYMLATSMLSLSHLEQCILWSPIRNWP